MPDGGKLQPGDMEDSFPMGPCQESRDAERFLVEANAKLKEVTIEDSPISLDTSDLLTAGLVTIAGPDAMNQLVNKTPISRGKATWLALLGTAAAIGAIIRPSDVFASTPDTPDASPDVFELEIRRQGGPDWRWLFNKQQVSPGDRTHGPFRMVGVNQPAAPAGYGMVPDPNGGPNPVNFFDVYGDMMEVILTDNETTSHTDGTQRGFNGSKDMTYPSIAALRAAVNGKGLPLALMSNTDINFTGGYVSANSVDTLGTIGSLTTPNVIVGKQNSDTIFVDNGEKHIALNRTMNVGTYADGISPRGRRVVPSLRSIGEKRKTAQSAAENVQKILADIDKIKNDPKNKNNPTLTAALLGVQLFKMKQLVGLVLQVGSFDTHGETNGAQQMAHNQTIMLTINAFFIACKAAGVKGRVALHGDFGRHAAGSGDPSAHHHVGSIVNIGEGIKGPRVIGKVDPNSSELIGEKNNYADANYYRRWLNGLTNAGKKLTDTTGVDVIKNLIQKQTAQSLPEPQMYERSQIIDPVRALFHRMFS